MKTEIKTVKEMAIWHGCDCHPELEDCIKAITEYHAQFNPQQEVVSDEMINKLELLADSNSSPYAMEINGYKSGVFDAIDLIKRSSPKTSEAEAIENSKMIKLLEFMIQEKMHPNGFGGWSYTSVNNYGSENKDIVGLFNKINNKIINKL